MRRNVRRRAYRGQCTRPLYPVSPASRDAYATALTDRDTTPYPTLGCYVHHSL